MRLSAFYEVSRANLVWKIQWNLLLFQLLLCGMF
jgi:hypothetical protein